jgi:hypothetical protein
MQYHGHSAVCILNLAKVAFGRVLKHLGVNHPRLADGGTDSDLVHMFTKARLICNGSL